MKIKLINPRGRAVEVDDREIDVSNLLTNGFSYPPETTEKDKPYNPVYDRGKYEPPAKDLRKEKPGISGDVLKVVEV